MTAQAIREEDANGIDMRRDSSQREMTRILAMSSTAALLKARLASQPSSRLALPSLLEAPSLWQGTVVRAALIVDGRAIAARRVSIETRFPTSETDAIRSNTSCVVLGAVGTR